MPTSFQEKSLWLVMLSLIAGFIWYFSHALQIKSEQLLAPHIVLFVVMVVFVIIAQIVGNILFAIAHHRELARGVQQDERDRLIRWKAQSLASYVLGAGVALSLAASILVPGNFVFTHVLLAFWAASQVLALALQLYFYQRGF